MHLEHLIVPQQLVGLGLTNGLVDLCPLSLTYPLTPLRGVKPSICGLPAPPSPEAGLRPLSVTLVLVERSSSWETMRRK